MADLLLENHVLLYGLTAILSALLVSEIPMFGMKIRSAALKDNAINLGFVLLFAVLVYFFKELAFSLIIIAYILLSLLLKNKVVEG